MRKLNHIYHNFKLFAVISLTTGALIFLFSLLGHFVSPGKLIPSCMIGGSIGILAGTYFLFRLGLIKKENIIALSICSLIAFGIISFIAVFNFDKPVLILCIFLLIGLTTVLSNRYFLENKNISNSLKYGLLGIILILPALYFISSSVLKFRFGINEPFNLIEDLLRHTNGQANFNAISPFIFGGGLLLAFFINLFVQIRLTKSKMSLIKFKLNWTKLKPFNLTVLLMSCSLSAVILTYLLLENSSN
jgi:hypothetical protein